jgi:hypothetical protein
MFFDRTRDFTFIEGWKNTNVRLLSLFQSLSGRHQITFLLENARNSLFHQVIRFVISFFEVTKSALLGDFLHDCTRGMAALIGLGDSLFRFWNESSIWFRIFQKNEQPSVIVGHRLDTGF